MCSPLHWLLTNHPMEQAHKANTLLVILLLMSWTPLLLILYRKQYSRPLALLRINIWTSKQMPGKKIQPNTNSTQPTNKLGLSYRGLNIFTLSNCWTCLSKITCFVLLCITECCSDCGSDKVSDVFDQEQLYHSVVFLDNREIVIWQRNTVLLSAF